MWPSLGLGSMDGRCAVGRLCLAQITPFPLAKLISHLSSEIPAVFMNISQSQMKKASLQNAGVKKKVSLWPLPMSKLTGN